MTLNYYSKVLDLSLRHFSGIMETISRLEKQCDSQLEVLFAINLISQFHWPRFPHLEITSCDDYIYLPEPFGTSPTQAGASVAYLTCQEKHNGLTWDFAIRTGTNNGATFSQCKSLMLIDVDGYGVHKHQRQRDERKLESATVKAIRLPEERFKNTKDIALAALFASVWHCYHEKDEDRKACSICSDLMLRPIFSHNFS